VGFSTGLGVSLFGGVLFERMEFGKSGWKPCGETTTGSAQASRASFRAGTTPASAPPLNDSKFDFARGKVRRVSVPTVSVVLPARNAGETIDAAVASIAAQTWRDFELLAIDDGSTDDTRTRLEAWARRDARVQVLETGGAGLVAALNAGLAQARGRFVARMDADDESLPERFAASIAALEAAPTLAGVGTGVDIMRRDRPPSPNLVAYGRWLSSLTSPATLYRDRFIESPLCHPSVMLRRAALDAVGGWRDEGVPEDWELWLRLLAGDYGLACLPRVLHRWFDHERRLTRTDARYAHARHLDLKARYLAPLLAGRPVAVFGATAVGRGLARRLVERGVRVGAYVELAPRKVGQRIDGVPVVHLSEAPKDAHALLCVAAKGAREDLRAFLTSQGRVELTDFTACA
jgi:glycosyltransferase involved in cell wall biosynthesis